MQEGQLSLSPLCTSEVYLLVNLFEKPVHNAVRRFSFVFSPSMKREANITMSWLFPLEVSIPHS